MFLKNSRELDIRIEAEMDFKAFNKLVALYVGKSGDNPVLHSFIQKVMHNINRNEYKQQSLTACRDRLYSLLLAEAKKSFRGDMLKLILAELRSIRFNDLHNIEKVYPYLLGNYWVTAD